MNQREELNERGDEAFLIEEAEAHESPLQRLAQHVGERDALQAKRQKRRDRPAADSAARSWRSHKLSRSRGWSIGRTCTSRVPEEEPAVLECAHELQADREQQPLEAALLHHHNREERLVGHQLRAQLYHPRRELHEAFHVFDPVAQERLYDQNVVPSEYAGEILL